MSHIKRRTISKLWPVPRTGSKYVAVPSHNKETSVPLMIIMRDVLGIVKNRKELKKILNEKKVIVNGKIVKETNYPVCLFDSVALPAANKYYKAVLKNRMELEPIKENEASIKIYKVIGKKILPGKKVQLNLSDGRNIISNDKINTGDFAVVDNAKNKIAKIIGLKKESEVVVIAGKHIGETGKIVEITKEGENTIALIKTKKGEVKANIKNVFAAA